MILAPSRMHCRAFGSDGAGRDYPPYSDHGSLESLCFIVTAGSRRRRPQVPRIKRNRQDRECRTARRQPDPPDRSDPGRPRGGDGLQFQLRAGRHPLRRQQFLPCQTGDQGGYRPRYHVHPVPPAFEDLAAGRPSHDPRRAGPACSGSDLRTGKGSVAMAAIPPFPWTG